MSDRCLKCGKFGHHAKDCWANHGGGKAAGKRMSKSKSPGQVMTGNKGLAKGKTQKGKNKTPPAGGCFVCGGEHCVSECPENTRNAKSIEETEVEQDTPLCSRIKIPPDTKKNENKVKIGKGKGTHGTRTVQKEIQIQCSNRFEGLSEDTDKESWPVVEIRRNSSRHSAPQNPRKFSKRELQSCGRKRNSPSTTAPMKTCATPTLRRT